MIYTKINIFQRLKKLAMVITGLFLLAFYASCTKDAPDGVQKESFLKYFGGPLQNSANGFVQIDDFFYLLGTVTEGGKNHITVIKTDDYGNSVWSKELRDTNYAISGSQIISATNGTSIAIIGTRTSDQDSLLTDFYFVKLDLTGSVMIEKTYELAYNQNGQSLMELSNGGFLLLGTSATESAPSGDYQLSFTIKADGGLNRIPVPKGSDSETIKKLVVVANDSSIFGIGSTAGKQSAFVHGSPQLLVFNDQQGTAPSPVVYPEIHGIFNDILQLSDDDFLVCGTRYTNTSNTDGFIALIKKSTFALSNFVPFDNDRNTQWNSITKSATGDILIAGSALNADGNYDLQILRVTTEGNINNQKTFGYNDNEYGVSLVETSDGRIVALGTFNYETNGMIALLKFRLN